ncbi:MAG TPA: GDSL-type esterase/lipase family protein [Capillimicrobium sp.]|jgi:lysophospholipase L1-like esterase
MSARRPALPSLLLALALAALAGPARADAAPARSACPPDHWVASWAAAPGSARVPGFEDQTLRMVVTPHLGGATLRLRLSNRFGSQPVTFDAVAVARRLGGAGPALEPGSGRRALFGGHARVTIAPGAERLSDPVALEHAALEPLAVSLSVRGPSGPATEHLVGQQTSYLTPRGSGEAVDDEDGDEFTETTTARWFLTAVDTLAPASTGALVAFGDSYTDGYLGSRSPLAPNLEGVDADGRYPDALRRRLLTGVGAPALSVVNAGISGNRLLADGLIPQHGPSALGRFASDALSQAGATQVLILGGANDLGARSATAPEITGALAGLVAQARAAGLSPLLGTIPPARGAASEDYGDVRYDEARREINAWIRAGGGADGIVDFDVALRDAADPTRLAARFDSGDGLHPNLDGLRAMAEAVSLAVLRAPAVAVPVGLARRDRRGLRHAVVRVDGRRVGVIRRPRDTVTVPLLAQAAQVTVTVRREGRPPARRALALGPC